MEEEPFFLRRANQNRIRSQWFKENEKTTNYDDIHVVEMVNSIPPYEMQTDNIVSEGTEQTSFLENLSMGIKTEK